MGSLTDLFKGGFLLLLGIGLVVGGWQFHQGAQHATENAIETEGTVLSAALTEKNGSGPNRDGTGSNSGYVPEIEYRYTYEGETYTSTSICPGTAEGCEASNIRSQDDVEGFLSQYPEGETVTVYVVPDEPSRAFLIETDSGSLAHFMMMGIGALLLLSSLESVASSLKGLVSG